MGLLQKACETYDYHENLAGICEANSEPLSPCSHMVSKSDLDITVNQDGAFVKAEAVDKKEPKIIIPITEVSSNRTGSLVAPHPLCEQLRYFMPSNKEHYTACVEQLRDWAESPFSHPKLTPILRYIERGTITQDLDRAGLLKWKDGKLENEKAIVRWRVVGLGLENSGPCWTDTALFRAFDAYYQDRKKAEDPVLCMVTGKMTAPARQHLKGVVSSHGNAKLISSNDSSNFTYRGRFVTPGEAETVGYEASQKAHNALRWLIANQGRSFGNRFFVCWEPRQLKLPDPFEAFRQSGVPGMELPPVAKKPSDYREQLQHTLDGWRTSLPVESAEAVIAAFDAATSGRLAITYYNELRASDFVTRLHDWDSWCCWPNRKFGIQSPSVWQIVNCAYGTQREEKGQLKLVTDDKLLRQQVQRLVACRIDRAHMPSDIVHRLVKNASEPLRYDWKNRETLLFTACAVLRKYDHDRKGEEWNMALEPEKRDRSYQFGRILALLEKMEYDTYDQDDKDRGRIPNAIRMQEQFVSNPWKMFSVLQKKVKQGYWRKLNGKAQRFYEIQLEEVMNVLSELPDCGLNDERVKPLGDSYLMGYYLEKQELYRKHDNDNNDNDDDGGEE